MEELADMFEHFAQFWGIEIQISFRFRYRLLASVLISTPLVQYFNYEEKAFTMRHDVGYEADLSVIRKIHNYSDTTIRRQTTREILIDLQELTTRWKLDFEEVDPQTKLNLKIRYENNSYNLTNILPTWDGWETSVINFIRNTDREIYGGRTTKSARNRAKTVAVSEEQ